MRSRWLVVVAIAGAVEAGCHSTTPSTLPTVSFGSVSAAAVTGGYNYVLTIHVANTGVSAQEVTSVAITFATSTVILGTNTPGLPFATTIPGHGSEDSRAINVTDTNAADPVATVVQVMVSFLDDSGLTSSVTLNGAVTLTTGTAPPTPTVPVTSFNTGRYQIGIDIMPGRYFAAPPVGCYLERESGLDGTSDEVLGDDFLAFAPPQWIVDIAPTDVGFETSGCGTWTQMSIAGSTTTIGPGMFLVSSQIASGTYQVAASAGCYWERLSDFSRTTASVTQSAFLPTAATTSVTLAATDVGFDTSPECGTWTPAPSASFSSMSFSTPVPGASGSASATRQAYRDWLKAMGRWRPSSPHQAAPVRRTPR